MEIEKIIKELRDLLKMFNIKSIMYVLSLFVLFSVFLLLPIVAVSFVLAVILINIEISPLIKFLSMYFVFKCIIKPLCKIVFKCDDFIRKIIFKKESL